MTNHSHPHPRSGPACASVAPLVALVVGQKPLPDEDAALLWTHLETCEYCRFTIDDYRRLDGALARHFAPPVHNPLSSAEVQAIISQDDDRRSSASARLPRPVAPHGSGPLVLPAAPRQRSGHRLLSALSALAAAILLAAVGVAVFVSHPSILGTSRPATPTATLPPAAEVPYAPGPKDILSSVFMVSATDGWAVGSSFQGPGLRDIIILHYTDGQWKQVLGVPDNAQLHASSTTLSQVIMISATEGWAVGNVGSADAQSPFGLLLHYTRGRWTVQQMIAHASLSGLAMTSASNGWAVGRVVANAPAQSLLLHYDGHRWTSVQAPGQLLLSVAMTSASDGWMTGSSKASSELGDMLFHYNGHSWVHLALPPGLSAVTHLSPVAPDDVWAVGPTTATGTPGNALARFSSVAQIAFVHYDGQQWTTAQVAPLAGQGGQISSLFMDGANDGWAIGWLAIPESGGVGKEQVIYLHYTDGAWTQAQGPDGDGLAVLFMLSASEGWAVGGDSASILHYRNGAWKEVL